MSAAARARRRHHRRARRRSSTPRRASSRDGRAPTPWRAVPTGAEIDPDELLDAAAAAAREAVAAPAGGQVAGDRRREHGRDRRAARRARPARRARRSPGTTRAAATRPSASPTTSAEASRPAPACPPARCARSSSTAGCATTGPDSAARRALAERGRVDRARPRRRGGHRAVARLAHRASTTCTRRRPCADALAWAGRAGRPGARARPRRHADGHGRDALPSARRVLTVGGHDHLAAAVGAGAAGEGDVLDSCGTAEAFVRAIAPARRTPTRRPRRRGRHHRRLARVARPPGAARRGCGPATALQRVLDAARGRRPTTAPGSRPPRSSSSGRAGAGLDLRRLDATRPPLRLAGIEPERRPPPRITRRSTPSARPARRSSRAWRRSPARRAGSSSPAAGRPARPRTPSRRAISARSSSPRGIAEGARGAALAAGRAAGPVVRRRRPASRR